MHGNPQVKKSGSVLLSYPESRERSEIILDFMAGESVGLAIVFRRLFCGRLGHQANGESTAMACTGELPSARNRSH